MERIWRSFFILLFLNLLTLGAPPSLLAFQGNLSDAVTYALAHNGRLKELAHLEEAARHGVRRSFASFLPRIEAQANYYLYEKGYAIATPLPRGSLGSNLPPQDLRLSLNSSAMTYDYTLGLKLVQPLFTGGQLLREYRLSSFAEESTKEEGRRLRHDLTYAVASAYFQVLILRRTLELQKENEELSEERVRLGEARKREGKASDYELLLAELDRREARAKTLAREEELLQAELSLKNLMNLPQDEELILLPGGEPPPLTCSLRECLELARASRPELKGLEIALNAQKERAHLARGGYFPQLALVGDWQYLANKRGSGVFSLPQTPGATAYSLILALHFPLFEGGKLYEEYEKGKEEVRALEERHLYLEMEIEREVREAYARREHARELVEAEKARLRTAEKARELAGTRYGQGLITLSELKEVELRHKEASLALLKAQFHALEAELLLRRATAQPAW